MAAGAFALLLIVIIVAVTRNGGSDNDSVARTRLGRPAATVRQPDTAVVPSGQAPASGSSPGSSRPGPSSTVPPPTTVPVALPPANPNAPPDPPVALYRQGKLFLEGSVPDEATAAGYLTKFRRILGPNVFVNLKRDPRVPAAPMRVIVEEQYQFPTGSGALDPNYNTLLDLGIYALKQLPEAKLVITGYTDNAGPAAVNQSLSEQRSRVVADYMVARGIPADRIVALGRGPADPIADNATPDGRQKNRRIEATLEGITP